MRQVLFMAKRKRRSFTAEFKADAVKLVQAGRNEVQLPRDLRYATATALGDWVRRAEIDAGITAPAPDRSARRRATR
jgi:transposase-like protein